MFLWTNKRKEKRKAGDRRSRRTQETGEEGKQWGWVGGVDRKQKKKTGKRGTEKDDVKLSGKQQYTKDNDKNQRNDDSKQKKGEMLQSIDGGRLGGAGEGV